MTQTALRLTTHVLPGNRLELHAPELTEGAMVDVFVVLSPDQPAPETEKLGVWDYIQSLPPSNLTADDWKRIEQEFQEERNSWGD